MLGLIGVGNGDAADREAPLALGAEQTLDLSDRAEPGTAQILVRAETPAVRVKVNQAKNSASRANAPAISAPWIRSISTLCRVCLASLDASNQSADVQYWCPAGVLNSTGSFVPAAASTLKLASTSLRRMKRS